MAVKNKLPNCKYTPRQFAQRVDYLVRRFENIQRKYPEIVVDMARLEVYHSANLRALYGCVAGIYAVGHNLHRSELGWEFGTSYSAFSVGRDDLLEFLGCTDKYNFTAARWFQGLGVDKCWPYNRHGFLSSHLAYGLYNPKELTWKRVIDTWKQFADNIRATPEKEFFNQSLELIHDKEKNQSV